MSHYATDTPDNPLGKALSIKQVAAMVGCSPWTVRYRLIPAGLPYFRPTASGKLVFFADEVLRWIKAKQQGGKVR